MDKLRLKPQFTSYREMLQYLYHNKGLDLMTIIGSFEGNYVHPELLVESIAFQLDRPRYDSELKPNSFTFPSTATRAVGLEPGFRSGEVFAGATCGPINGSRVVQPPLGANLSFTILPTALINQSNYEYIDILRLSRAKHYSNGQEFRAAVQNSPLQYLFKKFELYPYHLLGTNVVESIIITCSMNLAFGQAAQQNHQDPATAGGILQVDPANPDRCLGDCLNNWLLTTPDHTESLADMMDWRQITTLGCETMEAWIRSAARLVSNKFASIVHSGSIEAFDGIFGEDAEPVYIFPPQRVHKPVWAQTQPIPQIPLPIMRFFTSNSSKPRLLRRLVDAPKYRTDVLALQLEIEQLEEELKQLNGNDDDDAAESFKNNLKLNPKLIMHSVQSLSMMNLAASYVIATIQNDQEIVEMLEEFGINRDNYLEYTPEMRLAHLDDQDDEYLWFYPPGTKQSDTILILPEVDVSKMISKYTVSDLFSTVIDLASYGDLNIFSVFINHVITNQYNTFYGTEKEKVQEADGNNDKKEDNDKEPTPTLSQLLIPLHPLIDQIGYNWTPFESELKQLGPPNNSEWMTWLSDPVIIKHICNASHLLTSDGSKQLTLQPTCDMIQGTFLQLPSIKQMTDCLTVHLEYLKDYDQKEKNTNLSSDLKSHGGKRDEKNDKKDNKKDDKTKFPIKFAKVDPSHIMSWLFTCLQSPAHWYHNRSITSNFDQDLEKLYDIVEIFISNKFNLSIMSSGDLSIETNFNSYIESVRAFIAHTAHKFSYRFDQIQSQTTFQILNKFGVLLLKPLVEPLLNHHTSKSIFTDQLCHTFGDVILFFSAYSMIDAMEQLLEVLQPVIKNNALLCRRFFQSSLGFGRFSMDLRGFIQIPDIDALLYLDDDYDEKIKELVKNEENKNHTIIGPDSDDEEGNEKDDLINTLCNSYNTIQHINTNAPTHTEFSVYRTNHLLRFLPLNETTRLAFPQFFEYAPKPTNSDSNAENSSNDQKEKLLFNINTVEALSLKLPPPTFAGHLYLFNNQTNMLRKGLFHPGAVELMAERISDDPKVQQDFVLQCSNADDPQTLYEMSSRYRTTGLGAHKHDLDWLNYRFVLPQHRIGEWDDESLYARPKFAPDAVSALYLTHPSVLTLSHPLSSNDMFITPSDVFNQVELAIPYKIAQSGSLTFFGLWSRIDANTKPILDQLSAPCTTYEPSYINLFTPLEKIAQTRPNTLPPEHIMSTLHRGLKYLDRLCTINENNPNKSSQVPLLRWLAALKKTFTTSAWIQSFNVDHVSNHLAHAIGRVTPLILAITEPFVQPTAARFEHRMQVLFGMPLSLGNGFHQEMYAKNLAQSWILSFLGQHGGDSDQYYEFKDKDYAKLKTECVLDMTKAELITPSITYNLEDPDKKYFYNTPGMKSDLGVVLKRFYTWLSGRKDVLEYLSEKEQYLAFCETNNINPIVSFIDTSCDGILDQNPFEIDWDMVCSPQMPNDSGIAEEEAEETEEGEDVYHDEDQEHSYSTPTTITVAKPSLSTDPIIEEKEEKEHEETKSDSHPFITLSKSTPTWWAWDLCQFLTTSSISSLNPPPLNIEDLSTFKSYNVDALQYFQTGVHSPYPPTPDDDRVVDFNHNQISILNALIYFFTEQIGTRGRECTTDIIGPCLADFQGRLEEFLHRHKFGSGSGGATTTAPGHTAGSHNDSYLDEPFLELRGEAAFQHRPVNFRPFLYLLHHIHDIPSYIQVEPLPGWWQPKSSSSPLVGAPFTREMDDPNSAYIVARSRHLPHTVIENLFAEVLTQYSDGPGDLYDLYTQQCKGYPLPVSLKTIRQLTFQEELMKSVHPLQTATKMAAGILSLLTFPQEHASLFVNLPKVYENTLLKSVDNFISKIQAEKLLAEQQEEENNSSFWNTIGLMTAAMGVTTLVGGLLAAGFVWWKKNNRKNARRQKQQQQQLLEPQSGQVILVEQEPQLGIIESDSNFNRTTSDNKDGEY